MYNILLVVVVGVYSLYLSIYIHGFSRRMLVDPSSSSSSSLPCSRLSLFLYS